MYLSEHGLEEVGVPKPLGDLSTEEKGSVIVAQHMQTVRLCQRNPVEGGGGGGGGEE